MSTSKPLPVWRQCPDLMDRLIRAQSRISNIDIVTFAAFCDTRDELLRHVEAYEARTAA